MMRQRKRSTFIRCIGITYDTQQGFYKSGTHRGAGGHRSSWVPGGLVSPALDSLRLREVGRGTHKFDSDLLVVEEVCPLKNYTERTLSNLFPHSVVHTDNVGRRGGHFERARFGWGLERPGRQWRREICVRLPMRVVDSAVSRSLRFDHSAVSKGQNQMPHRPKR
jgi:hypothetical protein